MKTSSPKRTAEIRQANRQTIMRLLFLKGPMTRVELGKQSSLSLGTITNVTSELLRNGVLQETGMEESEGGRPRSILGISAQYGYLVGVDLGETHVQLELFDLGLKKFGVVRHNLTSGDNSPETYVNTIAEGLNELIISTQISHAQILGMGVGVPGVVEHNGQISVSGPLWNWNSVSFLAMLENRIPIPIYIDNGAKAMALAEHWFGAGRGAQDLVVVLLGTGVGAAIITKGDLYRGATNSAGEWGHTKIVLDGRTCRCGSQGCIEAYAGAPGIIATLHELTNEQPYVIDDQFEDIRALVEARQTGEPNATQTLYNTARYLGAGLANLVNLFNPECIVLGGWVGSQIGETIMPDLKKFVRMYALPPSQAQLKILLCEFGQDSICTGAACLVIEEFLSANRKFTLRARKG